MHSQATARPSVPRKGLSVISNLTAREIPHRTSASGLRQEQRGQGCEKQREHRLRGASDGNELQADVPQGSLLLSWLDRVTPVVSRRNLLWLISHLLGKITTDF